MGNCPLALLHTNLLSVIQKNLTKPQTGEIDLSPASCHDSWLCTQALFLLKGWCNIIGFSACQAVSPCSVAILRELLYVLRLLSHLITLSLVQSLLKEGDDRGWDGWMASLTQLSWVWVNSRSWWWTGRPGVLRSMGSQRVGHDWATELNWISLSTYCCCLIAKLYPTLLWLHVL